MTGVLRIPIDADIDVVTARLRGSEMAARMGFSQADVLAIALAISEVAQNIVCYAGRGEIIIGQKVDGITSGIYVIARDKGPGIADIDRAMLPGYSTGRSLGLGLPSAAQAMDEFEIISSPRQGTTIAMSKWLHKPCPARGR